MTHDLRAALVTLGFDVSTVSYVGLRGTKNGELIRQAAAAGFSVLITTDAGIAHQHNPAALPFPIVVLHPRSNQYIDIKPMLPKLERILRTPLDCGFHHVTAT